ncbi:DUF2690 domain-containing protein [Streptomyces sp. H10-C2]|uniref:DUF2690 domain-containing protein n=1 Tax=unclassified Streptomyces TaxID=2593676 RepID=UPI0024BAFAE6|nr:MULTISPECIES: DUF2690 domain-containing protein [unclassified Streptomyces]MDJ0342670.1 DUF2690 domain-containing protein [Streptomyces sp. PH10-H1]MDJ0372621.1 DUF2690 domain-containing protein [Streptomyces sp. H10-C2]
MRTNSRRFATAGAVMTLAASGLMVGVASPASAATSCYASNCTGLDPAATICANDATTVDIGFTGIELRYSPTCRAAWARRVGGVRGDSTTIKIANTNGQSYSKFVPDSASGNYYTLMVNDAGIQSQASEKFTNGGYSTTILY